QRDQLTLDDTPIDYLDFASPKSGRGGKLGMDANNKIGAETDREWGVALTMSEDVTSRMDEIWGRLGLGAGRP
ncbi:MAG: 3-octaprenyl-4-hydroxybenzoate decarboxylase, partial [Sphingobium sp.]